MPPIEITPNVHWIGVNDRTTDLFEGLWPITQEGVSYNAYLINDEKKAIVDLSKALKTDEFLDQINEITDVSQLDYVIVNHMEPDHSGVLRTLRLVAPQTMILGTEKTRAMLESFYGITEGVQVVADGETLSLGQHTLHFVHTPFVHWPETMMTYEASERILFSCDAFGSYGALRGGIFDDECTAPAFYEREALRYYVNIVATFSKPVLKAIDKLADVLDEMEPDEAADLLGDLPPKQAAEALQQMEDTEDVLQLLEYPDQTAGGRMTTDFVAVSKDVTAAEAINTLRYLEPDHEVPYYVFVVDDHDVLVGVTGLRELVVSKPETPMETVMDPTVISANALMDQEEVAQMMSQYDLSALPVVNTDKHLIGVITHDDLIDVIQEEATEDIYRLANVTNAELEPDSPVSEQLKGRLPWLFLNMFTALFASWVISNFEGLISQVAVLAVFQSIVAGQGGNAASQSVAMFVRALALGNIPPGRTMSLLFRQMIVGLFQGIAVGALIGIGVYLWKGNAYLGLVLGISLVGNMILAAIVGTLIPMGLKAIDQDPAMASSVLVTAVTDSLGFFIFLSLAKIFFQNLI